MVLYLIGLGLNGTQSITLHGKSIMISCSALYMPFSESYGTIKKKMEDTFAIEISWLNVEEEEKCNAVVMESLSGDVAILSPEDPFFSLPFTKLKLKSNQLQAQIEVVHNCSRSSAIGCSGLQLYRFGCISSLASDDIDTIANNIKINLQRDLHSLCLPDLNPQIDHRQCCFHESGTWNKFFSVLQSNPTLKKCTCIAVAHIGTEDQCIYYSTAKELFSQPCLCEPDAIILCGILHPMEEEALIALTSHYNPGSSVTNTISDSTSTTFDSKKVSKGRLSMVGLGLGQPSDVSVEGRDAIQRANVIYLESYTSVMIGGKEALESFFGKEIKEADRELVEQQSVDVLKEAEEGREVVVLVVGDPLGATTHTDLLLRALQQSLSINVINNASILNASACCGLRQEAFGEVVSIPFWEDTWKPYSFCDKIEANLKNGWHTLCLLDIKVKEQSLSNLARGRRVFEPPRFMSVRQAAEQIIGVMKERDGEEGLNGARLCVCLVRIGTPSQVVQCLPLEEVCHTDLGAPLHSLVVVGNTTPQENLFLNAIKCPQ